MATFWLFRQATQIAKMEAEVVSPLKAEAEPRVPCVPRREPGNENGARVGKKVAATGKKVTAIKTGEIRMLG